MRTHTRLKIFFVRVLIGLATLTTLALATGARQRSAKPNAFSGDSLSFLPAVTYDSGGSFPSSVAVADVNGDGKPDLLVANTGPGGTVSGTVSVLLGNGDGTFQAAVSYGSGGSFTYSLAVGDVNGDGKPDLVVANAHSNTVGVLLGHGDGTFAPAVTFDSSGVFPDSVAIADVNGDGVPDIVVVDQSSDIAAVLLGNGDGTFRTGASYYAGRGPISVAVADINGDGKPDIVVADCGADIFCPTSAPGAVSILLGNGDGTFQAAVSYSSGGISALSVAVADVNGDGKLDLLVANSGSGTVGVLLGNGDGTFQAALAFDSGGSIYSQAVVADVNGDGKLDLLVANFPGTVVVLLGNGDGTFQAALAFSSGGSGPTSVAVKDVNGDGKPDVIVANINSNSVGVLLNNTTLGKSSTSTSFISSSNPSIYGQKVTWTATVTSSGSVTPTGKVQFTWSGHTIGSVILNTNGVATFSRSNLNADPYPLMAVYVGDAANLRSTSPVLNQVVLETTSAATLTSSPNPSTRGQAVTFTVRISSPTVVPTGPVTFTSGKAVLGTAQLSGGKAKLAVSSLPVGSTKVTVTYYGDSNIAKSSASVIQTVH
jgi:Bacterial Ig-like domain (group 3)/FG-GAP-like repeat